MASVQMRASKNVPHIKITWFSNLTDANLMLPSECVKGVLMKVVCLSLHGLWSVVRYDLA